MSDEIKILQKELKAERKRNDALIDKMAQLGATGIMPNSSGSKNSSDFVKKRSFDQLVKEVDQCFAELGRQVQREAKHRQNIEETIDQIQHDTMNPADAGSSKLDGSVEKRLIKLENSLAETRKDAKKERKKIEKSLSTAHEPKQIDQKVIEDTIQTILVDVVDELTSNEARLYESVERRMKNLEETVEQTQNSRALADRKTNNELRRLGVLVDSSKMSKKDETLPAAADITVDVPNVAEDLRITIGSLQEKSRILDEQQQEQERRLNLTNHSFQKDVESFRAELHKTAKEEKELERRISAVEKNVTTGINAPGRTVSIGPNPTDLTTLRKQLNQLEEKHDKLKTQLDNRPVPSSVISPGLAKLNENVTELENSVSALRTEVEADRNRLDNVRHESQGKIRAIRDELRSLRPKQPPPKSPVEVIVSTDNPEHAKCNVDDDSGLVMSKTEIDAIISKIAKLEKQGVLNNTPSIGQTEFMREVEILSDENQRLWRSLTKIEENLKNISVGQADGGSDDPATPGALASAINKLQTQISTGIDEDTLDGRLKRIERELADKSDRGTDRIWRHLSNLEEQMTRRHGETDERITLIESQTHSSDSGLDSDNLPVDERDDCSKSSTTQQKNRSDRYWAELGALKAKVSEIIGRDLLDIKKSLNTSAQRAEVRRLALDVENIKVEFVKPIDEKVRKLSDELQKRRKHETRKTIAPVLEVIPSSRPTTNSITKSDMKEFEEKLDKFKSYWIDESEKFAKTSVLEMLIEDLESLKQQIIDLNDNEKRDIKSIENKLEVFAEDIENSVDAGRAADREYINARIEAIQNHGISASALENIATLQHRLIILM